MLQLQSFLGIFVFLGIAWFFSENRKKVIWQRVLLGILLQLALAVLVLGIPALGFSGPLNGFFSYANDGILKLLQFTEDGSVFIFGDLASFSKSGFIIAFQVLPIIIFMSSLMTILYYLGLMQKIVYGFAIVMQKFLGLSGAESLAAAANVFVGQTEAPLIIRPYLNKMTSSELFSMMVGGMATIAGAVMAAYVGLLKDAIPNIGGHLLTASILSAPAALVIAKIMVPETKVPETMGRIPKDKDNTYVNVIEAAAAGASDGVKLAVNVGAMLLAFVAIIAMLDSFFIFSGEKLFVFYDFITGSQTHETAPELSISYLLSWFFMPIGFFIGIPFSELGIAGSMIGKKIVFNEFIAYLDLAKFTSELNPRTSILLSYALCGFANFSSIAIQIGGMGPLIPDRKKELAQFGIRAVIGGSLAAFITASVAGLLI